MVFEPAIKQSIIDDHDDPQSRLNFDKQAPENEKTNLGFYTNSTDQWRIDIELEYLIEAIDPRETTVTFQAGGRNLMTTTYLDVGFISCFNFIINSIPPIINLTEEQILELGFTTSKEQIKELADESANLVTTVEESQSRNDFMAIMYSVIFIAVMVGGFLQRRTGRKLKIEMSLEKIALNKERNQIKLARLHDQTEGIEFNKTLIKNFESVTDQIMIIARTLELDLRKIDWRQAYQPKDTLKPKKKVIEIKTEPIDEKTQKENEEVYETELLGKTQEQIKKESKLKMPSISIPIPDILKRKKDEEPEVRTKEWWKTFYRKDIGDDIGGEKYLDHYIEIQKLYEKTPTNELLTQLYAIYELAVENIVKES